MTMYLKILVIISVALIGFLLKKVGILSKKDGEIILSKLVFNLVLPVAIFLSLSQSSLSWSLVYLPISALVIILICFAVSWLYTGAIKLNNKTKGTFIIGTMLMNTSAVAFPFFQLIYGNEGFGRVAIFDFAGAFLGFSLVYFLAVYYGNSEKKNIRASLIKIIKTPVIWALLLGIGVNLLGFSLPIFLKETLDLIAMPITPLFLISLGLYFEPKLDKIKQLFPAIFIRFGVGLAAGLLMVKIFNLEGLNRAVVLISSVAPSAYLTLIYSVKEKLDEDFAASLVAVSVVVGLIMIPIFSFFKLIS